MLSTKIFERHPVCLRCSFAQHCQRAGGGCPPSTAGCQAAPCCSCAQQPRYPTASPPKRPCRAKNPVSHVRWRTAAKSARMLRKSRAPRNGVTTRLRLASNGPALLPCAEAQGPLHTLRMTTCHWDTHLDSTCVLSFTMLGVVAGHPLLAASCSGLLFFVPTSPSLPVSSTTSTTSTSPSSAFSPCLEPGSSTSKCSPAMLRHQLTRCSV